MDTIIIIAIIGAVVVLIGRRLHRTLTGKNPGCCCSSQNCATSACAGKHQFPQSKTTDQQPPEPKEVTPK